MFRQNSKCEEKYHYRFDVHLILLKRTTPVSSPKHGAKIKNQVNKMPATKNSNASLEKPTNILKMLKNHFPCYHIGCPCKYGR